jgi:hypothetical protein
MSRSGERGKKALDHGLFIGDHIVTGSIITSTCQFLHRTISAILPTLPDMLIRAIAKGDETTIYNEKNVSIF